MWQKYQIRHETTFFCSLLVKNEKHGFALSSSSWKQKVSKCCGVLRPVNNYCYVRARKLERYFLFIIIDRPSKRSMQIKLINK